jgi:hypothetical protein
MKSLLAETAERPVEMTPTEDQRPVRAFTSDGADPSFGEGVRSRSADRGEDGLDAVRGEDLVEAPRVLGVSVPDQVAKPSPPWQVPREVAGRLRDPGGVGMAGHAGQMDMPRPELDEEGDVERAEPDGLDGEEVGRQDPACLVAQELRPGRT